MQNANAGGRQGPLTALVGEEPALAIGDIEVRHVRLRPDGLTLHLGDTRRGFVPWAAVRELAVAPPTTWWPNPALGDSVLPVLEGLMGGSEAIPESPTFTVRITTAEFEVVEWVVTGHFVSGYRRRDAAVTTRLCEYLVARPEARLLLAQPEALLDRVAVLLRPAPLIGK